MKRLFAFLITIIIASAAFPVSVQAGNGDACRAAGYDCTTSSLCQPPRQNLGPSDCYQGGKVGNQVCCGKPRQLNCGDSCINATECPSSCPACQKQSQGGETVCRVAGPVYLPICDICRCAPPGVKIDCPNCDSECQGCVNAGNSWTAIGCITTSDPQAFVAWLLSRAIGIAGGIAFLLMVFAGFQIITSAGDPKRLQSGKEMLTSAIIGLIVIIFAVFLLQLIGVQILKIPGWK